jgi:hypothetical protein
MRTFILFLLLLTPGVTLAALVPCSGPDCNVCSLVALGQHILTFLIEIGVAIAAIGFAVAGYYMVTSGGDPGQVTKARTIFTNVLIGFIILLAAWLIVDTVMKMLVDNQKLGPWNELICASSVTSGAGQQQQLAIDVVPQGNLGGANTRSDSMTKLSQADAVSEINQNNQISLKQGASLDNINQATLDEVFTLQKNCNCSVVITSGTDGNHAVGTFSHANGYKIDLRTSNNPDLLNYIESLPSLGTRSSDNAPVYTRPGGDNIEYAIENDHLDVLVLPKSNS